MCIRDSSSLEVDGVSQIFTLFKNVADGGRTPVSYTHLDVYKRQWKNCREPAIRKGILRIVHGLERYAYSLQ